MLETKSDVEQFLTLQEKPQMGLPTGGTKEQLINQLASVETQKSVFTPQAIPLRTRDKNMQPLDAAVETIRHWRKLIFEANDNIKKFKLLSSDGKPYAIDLPYLKCSTEVLQKIIESGWYLPLDHNKDLIELLKTNPDKFVASIIQKPDSKGKSWIMVHVQPKAA